MRHETRQFTVEEQEFLDRLYEIVLDANRRMNLTRITGRDDFFRKHVLDSILPFMVVPELKELEGRPAVAADVGSGGGFPGLVLAGLYPRWSVVLFERTQKKAAFLEEAARTLGLENVQVVPKDSREAKSRFDLVTARAVGRIAAVTRAAAHLLLPGGLLVHYKGGAPDADELEEGRLVAARLGLDQEEPCSYPLPPDAMRSVVVSRARRRRRGGSSRRTRAT